MAKVSALYRVVPGRSLMASRRQAETADARSVELG